MGLLGRLIAGYSVVAGEHVYDNMRTNGDHVTVDRRKSKVSLMNLSIDLLVWLQKHGEVELIFSVFDTIADPHLRTSWLFLICTTYQHDVHSYEYEHRQITTQR